VTGPAAHVLVFAPGDDAHAAIVDEELCRRGVETARLDYGSAAESVLRIEPGAVSVNGLDIGVSWTVWWRRSGQVADIAGMPSAEKHLRREETQALTLGGLLSVGPRWVDEPHVVERAEHTLLQLGVAAAAGARTPATVATNDPRVALQLLAGGPCVAKSTSAGVGLAPYVDVVTDDLLELLPVAATLLQRRVDSDADLRVVVVGSEAFVWRRLRRSTDPVDWRAADPDGAAFRPARCDQVERLAPAINDRLGLTFSVQDWVEDSVGPWFLEVNPSGQWLFLDDADRRVVPALAAHLAEVTL
jgi:hypothetical protein